MAEKHPFQKYIDNGIRPSCLPTHNLSKKVVEWIKREYFIPDSGVEKLQYHWPNVDKDHNPPLLMVWPNADAREKGRKGRQPIKPGKFFRSIFPEVSDKGIERRVESFYREFSAAVLSEVFSGKTSEDFLYAYTHDRSSDRNFETKDYHKRLCDSCMRYEKGYFGAPIHPVEVYGTGDWTVFWVEDSEGKIVSRCTAYFARGKYQLGPIYSTCEQGIKKLEDYFSTIDTTGVGAGDWEGARVELYKYGGRYVGPYFDQASDLIESSCGRYLVIDENGYIEQGHQGFYEEAARNFCDYFSEYTNEEVTYVRGYGHVCETAISEYFFLSEYDEEFYHNDKHTVVYASKFEYEQWSDDQAQDNAMYCEEFDDYVKEDSVVKTSTGEFIPEWYIGKEWFICEGDGLAHETEEMIEHDGKFYAKSNAPEGSEHFRCEKTDDMLEKEA